jgi:hypothetical protein
MKPTAAHLKLLQQADEGDSPFLAARNMGLSVATTEKLFYELCDANMLAYDARDEPMQLTRLGRAVLKGGVGTFKLAAKKKAAPRRTAS